MPHEARRRRIGFARHGDREALRDELDRALRDAATDGDPWPRWVERVEWLGQRAENTKGKTYIAALGAALLAKATDPRVDSLTQKKEAGPNGYSLRSVAELLQRSVRGRVHLGTPSKNPLNNSSFYRGPVRIDRFTAIAGYIRPIYDALVRWLDELDGYTAEQAHAALVAFLHVRIDVQRREVAAAAASPRMGRARSLADLVDALQTFLVEDSEEGGRGQAVVAAILGCAWPDVEVVPKHHPAPFDIKRAGIPSPLVCEVKQVVVTDKEVLELARRAHDADVAQAVYAALHPDQRPLPVERLRADALDHHGVLLDVCRDVRELVARIGVYSGLGTIGVCTVLPGEVVKHAMTADVSSAGQRRLLALLRGVRKPAD